MNIQTKSYSMFTVVDLICMSIGFFLGIFIRHGDFAIMDVYSVYREVYVVLAISIIVNAFLFRPYEDFFHRGFWVEFVNVVKCLCVQIAVAFIYMFMMQITEEYSRLAFAFAIISISVFTYIGRLLAKTVLRNFGEKSIYRKKFLIVTTSDKAEGLLQSSRNEVEFSYQITALAIMDRDLVGESIHGGPITVNEESLNDDARLKVVDSV